MARLTKSFKGKLHSYFIQKIGAYDYRHGWMKSDCPYCGREGKYGINISYDRSNCFVCGEHPNLLQLVMYLENFNTYSEVSEFLRVSEFLSYGYKEAKVEIQNITIGLQLPESFILFGSPDGSVIGKSATNYMLSRGFTIEELRYAGWGYCIKGKFLGYIIIPFFQDNKLVYYNGRKFIGLGSRYKNPDKDDTGLGKSFIIYNKDALFIYNKVYLCEGAINARTMGDKGIASGGKHISRHQLNTILNSPVKDVVVLLDTDAKAKAIEVALQLSSLKRVKVVFFDEDKDANDIGRKRAMETIREVPYMTYNELLTLKQRILKDENTVYTY